MADYFEKTTEQNETVVMKAKFFPVEQMLACGLTLLFLIIFEIAVSVPYIFRVSGLTETFTVIFVIAFIIVEAIFVVPTVLYIKTTELSLTNKGIVGKTGLFLNKNIINIPFDKIQNVTVKQRAFSPLFDYATLRIYTTIGDYSFYIIKDANGLKKAIMSNK